MKVGVNLLLWTGCFKNEDVSLFARMKKIGFDGVELPLFDIDSVDAALVKKELNSQGLEGIVCTVIPPDCSLIDPDPAHRQNGVDFIKKAIDFTHAIDGKLVAGPLYSPVGKLEGRGRTDVEWNHAVQALKDVSKHAEKAGIRIAFEALNRFETYFLNIGEDVVKLCEEIGSDMCGYHYDTFHANIEEKNPVETIRKCGSRIYHFHCSENDRGIVGSGHVDWKGSFAALKEIGYDEWLVIESFLPAIKEIAAAASIWRELAPSADILAKESLEFIRANIQ